MTVQRLAAGAAGCYVDGVWGQYGGARMIQVAGGFGFDDNVLQDIAGRHLACVGPSDAEMITDDEHEILSDGLDVAESWLNDNVAPEGFTFGWHDGEFFLQSEQWWAES